MPRLSAPKRIRAPLASPPLLHHQPGRPATIVLHSALEGVAAWDAEINLRIWMLTHGDHHGEHTTRAGPISVSATSPLTYNSINKLRSSRIFWITSCSPRRRKACGRGTEAGGRHDIRQSHSSFHPPDTLLS